MNRSAFEKDTAFPPLPLEEWKETKDTLHLYLQIVGKIRLMLFPSMNQWWHVTLYPSTRGLTTRPIPYGFGNFEIEFDFIKHKLDIRTSGGEEKSFPLIDGLTVADFYKQVFANLDAVGIETEILALPYDMPTTTPFAEDTEHRSYDREYIERFRRILIGVNDVFEVFRGRFTGKSSPVHMFWHSFDLALNRFSGEPAPVREGAGYVEREAYSQEVISFGFWAGDDNVVEPAFYAYIAPEPEGFSKAEVLPAEGYYRPESGLFILPYEAVRRSSTPEKDLLDFLQSTYEAGATLAGWDLAEREAR